MQSSVLNIKSDKIVSLETKIKDLNKNHQKIKNFYDKIMIVFKENVKDKDQEISYFENKSEHS